MTKRNYIKGNPEITPNEVVPKKTTPQKVTSSFFEAPKSYIKQGEFEDMQTFIVIFSGGTTREKNYFSGIGNGFKNIKIHFVPEPDFESNRVPKVFNLAYNTLDIYKNSVNEDLPDKYYIVTDVDDFKQAILEHKPLCEQKGIELIISNPCFEVWLYYSKQDDKFLGFKMPSDLKELSQNVKTFVGKTLSIVGGVNPTKALEDLEQNIVNAKKNYQASAEGIPDLFSTNMFILGEYILKYKI